jgi:hypothetical protein
MSPVLRLVVQDQNRGAADQKQADAMSFDNVVRGRFEIFRLDCWIIPTVSTMPMIAVARVTKAGPCVPPTSLIEVSTVIARGFAGQPVKSGGERARVAEANIECNSRDGQFAIRQ